MYAPYTKFGKIFLLQTASPINITYFPNCFQWIILLANKLFSIIFNLFLPQLHFLLHLVDKHGEGIQHGNDFALNGEVGDRNFYLFCLRPMSLIFGTIYIKST